LVLADQLYTSQLTYFNICRDWQMPGCQAVQSAQDPTGDSLQLLFIGKNFQASPLPVCDEEALTQYFTR